MFLLAVKSVSYPGGDAAARLGNAASEVRRICNGAAGAAWCRVAGARAGSGNAAHGPASGATQQGYLTDKKRKCNTTRVPHL